MACTSPLRGWKSKNGNTGMGRAPPDSDTQHLPCGECIGCRKSKALAWTLRCQLELTQHDRAAFTTLTYDEKRLPPTLDKIHYSGFFKRLRERLSRQEPARAIRHFGCGEYGEENGRPHYHSIIFGADEWDRQLIHDAWGKGITDVQHATRASIAYVAGYVQKKYGDLISQHYKREDLISEHGEVYRYQPPFLQMSRGGRQGLGIGGHAKQYTNSWREFAVLDGIKMPVPKYFHDAWKAQATPEALELLEYEQFSRRMQREIPDLIAQREINIAKRELQAAKRKL